MGQGPTADAGDRDAPPDWRRRWGEALSWPGAEETDPEADLAAHRAWRPPLDGCGLVLIDVDKKSFDRKIERWTRHDAAAGRAMAQRVYGVALPNMIRLVEFFRRVRRPVVFVQWGWHRFQYPPLEPLPGEDVVVKRTRGAFGGSNLDDVLKRRGVTAGVFAGADTALCVASTVRGAIDAGYRAVLVEDACVSALSRLHEATVETLGYLQAVVLRTDEVLALERPTPA